MFEDTKILFYLTADSVQAIGENINKTLKFSQESVKNQEMANEEKLQEDLLKFINEQKLVKQNSLIILSDDLVFHKSISMVDKEKADEEYKAFISQIPFKEVSKIKYQDNNILIAVAAGKNLYLPVKEYLETLGWKITAVVPAVVFGDLINVKDFKYQDIKHITGSKIFKEVNFLLEREEKPPDEGQENITPGKNKLLLPVLGVAAIIIAIIVLAVIFRADFIKQKAAEVKTLPTVVPTMQPTATPSATPTAAKSDLKVEVLNGSGVPGQAGKIRSQLITLGYKSIEVGNLENIETGTSSLQINSKVSAAIKEELTRELKKTLGSITEEATNSADFDLIVITRGG